MTPALDLAERVRTLAFDELPPEAVHWARIGIPDTIGVTLAGSHDDSTRIVGTVSGGGQAGVERLCASIQDIEKLKDVRAVTAIVAGDIDRSKLQAAA